jgi:hypothetical protein
MGDRRFSRAQKDTAPGGESPITAAQYEELRAFDAALHVGQRVMIRWTQGHRFYAMPARITKVNPKSVLAALDEALST